MPQNETCPTCKTDFLFTWEREENICRFCLANLKGISVSKLLKDLKSDKRNFNEI